MQYNLKFEIMKTQFTKGDYIYYYRKIDRTFETVPSKILKVNTNTLFIEANFNEGTRNVRVNKSKCELQEEYYEI